MPRDIGRLLSCGSSPVHRVVLQTPVPDNRIIRNDVVGRSVGMVINRGEMVHDPSLLLASPCPTTMTSERGEKAAVDQWKSPCLVQGGRDSSRPREEDYGLGAFE